MAKTGPGAGRPASAKHAGLLRAKSIILEGQRLERQPVQRPAPRQANRGVDR
jgi:hypothetical protein